MIWSLLQGALVLALVAGLFIMALRQNLPEPDARSLAFAAWSRPISALCWSTVH